MTNKTDGTIVAYKAFDKDLKCRGFQYEIGKTYEHKSVVSLCSSGFHSCQNPLDVLDYYDICDGIRFAQISASGKIERKTDGDTKIASASIAIEVELSLPDFVGRAIKWVADACKGSDVEVTSGNYAMNASSGDAAKNTSSGRYAMNASSGDYAENVSIGHYAKNVSIGKYATNASSGRYTTNASSGLYAKNTSSGHYARNASSGRYAANASSGHHARNASNGNYATNASSGRYATNVSIGDFAKNVSSGDSGYNEASGEHAVICGAGRDTQYKGAKGVWISAAEYAEIDGASVCIGFATGQAGYDDVPADVWLKASGGKLVQA